jgi:hypothetical protein
MEGTPRKSIKPCWREDGVDEILMKQGQLDVSTPGSEDFKKTTSINSKGARSSRAPNARENDAVFGTPKRTNEESSKDR